MFLLAALPGTGFLHVIVRAIVLCVAGGGIYVMLAQLFGIRELAKFERMLMRRLRWRRAGLTESGAPRI